ncbi:ABC transporter permease [Rhodanobacter sp. AS-Z3]|uniref:ABC transporter permease n=1 Tax=Rhodanobacter sp. AS-Z3 TaxID=3031330 RepID=UPI0024789A80|nr:ABC transporter permease [Rhodanobacter sp. AS-Z3]WEN16234.1 ABC transporter permease [Rhodanobacter sp. AS-Z3]
MWGYNMELAWRGLRHFPRITLLNVLALALGLGATVTAQTVTRLLSGDPLPNRSGSLYAVQMDARSKADIKESSSSRLPDLLPWLDVQQLQHVRPATPQTAVINTDFLTVSGTVGGAVKEVKNVSGLQVQSAFFDMFAVPLLQGRAWSTRDDEAALPVAVISSELSHRLFGDASALGQSVQIGGKLFRVVAVSGVWKPYPHFYGLGMCVYACPAEEVFIPVAAAREQGVRLASFSTCGTQSITKPDAAICPYLGFWVQLSTAEQRADYRQMLTRYADTQHAAGRFANGGASAVGLQDVHVFLDAHHLVPVSARFGVWLSLSFLLVCLANVAGLLLTRFLRSSVELGIRRALGASRRAIFSQCLLEAGLIGVSGGVLALPLVGLGLYLVRLQPVAYASVIRLDWSVALTLLLLSLVASLAIGTVPAWRASVVEPGLQVKEN